jgi:signal transduction histidine kinase
MAQQASTPSPQSLLSQIATLQQEVQKLQREKELMQAAMTFSDEVTDELYSTVEVSQRESAEQAAASRAKSAFLAHMSHELRTPLGFGVLARFVIKMREQDTTNVILQASKRFFWQRDLLIGLQRLLPKLELQWE